MSKIPFRKFGKKDLEKSSSKEGDLSEPTSETEDAVGELQDAEQKDLGTVSRLDSFSSVSSIYSADGGNGNQPGVGKIEMGIWYKNSLNLLFMKIVKVKGLAKRKNDEMPDPYVKTYLLPDQTKLTKRKTGIQRKTTSPVYEETLKNKLPSSDIRLTTLLVSVWDWDKYGRNKFLGEVRLPLSTMRDLTNPTHKDRVYELKNRSEQSLDLNRGKLTVAVKFVPYSSNNKNTSLRLRRGSLFVSVKKAEGLPVMDPTSQSTDASVKLYLLPKRILFAKKTTQVVNSTLDPVWNEEFEFKRISLEDITTSRVLELSVWDYDLRGCKDFIGCIRLGPNPAIYGRASTRDYMDSRGLEVEQWMKMLDARGEWVEYEHELRPSIKGVDTSHVTPDLQEQKEIEELSIKSGSSVAQDVPDVGASMRQMSQLTISSNASSSFESADSDDNDNDADTSSIEDSLCDSKTSLYGDSCVNVKGNYTITGEVCISLAYVGGLRVTIHRATNLAAADSNGLSDPYIKTYLLPHKGKHSKGRTAIKKKTLNPVYDETINYDVEESALASRTLLLSVWDWDLFGKNEFLGEIRLPLASIDLSDCKSKTYPLQDTDNYADASSAPLAKDRGRLLLGLKFEPHQARKGSKKGLLHVHVKSAESLPKMDILGNADAFVKINLLPNQTRDKKSRIISNSLNPEWNEKLVIKDVNFDELSTERALELTVWDYDKLSSSDFIGGLRLGPALTSVDEGQKWMDSNSGEASHWAEMLAHPGEWVERNHPLRTSMDFQKRQVFKGEPKSCNDVELDGEEENMAEGFRPRSSHMAKNVMSPKKKKVLRSQKQIDDIAEEPQAVESDQDPSSLAVPSNSGADSRGFSLSPSPFTSPYHQQTTLQLQKRSNSISVMSPSQERPPIHEFREKRKSRSNTDLNEYAIDCLNLGTGEVLCAFNYKGGQLTLTIIRARGLPCLSPGELPNPHIEVSLLPEQGKHPPKKAEASKLTRDPVFNFPAKYKVPEIASCSLLLRVWDSSKTAGIRLLGEIRFTPATLNLTDNDASWYKLYKGDDESVSPVQLKIALKFQVSTVAKKGRIMGDLHVLYKEVKNLSSDFAVRCSLSASSSLKKKLSGLSSEVALTRDQELVFQDLKLNEMQDKFLDVNVWDQGRLIGGIHFVSVGRSKRSKERKDSLGLEARHWDSVFANPGEWKEQWHRLEILTGYRFA